MSCFTLSAHFVNTARVVSISFSAIGIAALQVPGMKGKRLSLRIFQRHAVINFAVLLGNDQSLIGPHPFNYYIS